MKPLHTLPILAAMLLTTASCATLTNDAHMPMTLSFSDGSEGECKLSNKRQSQEIALPGTASVRRSDDALKYDCTTEDGRTSFGAIPSKIGAKIIASAVFLDFGITDAITDKHREYPVSFVIPVKKTKHRK